jgi:hypothetical protein
MWSNSDYGPYEKEDTDRSKITKGIAVPCRLCENAFRRLRLTLRYCIECEHGFCDGEHGNLVFGKGRCVQCGPHVKNYPISN